MSSIYFEILMLIMGTLVTLMLTGLFISAAKEWFIDVFLEPRWVKQIAELSNEAEYWRDKFKILPVSLNDVDRIIDCKVVCDENHMPVYHLDEDGNCVFTLTLVVMKPDGEVLRR